MIRNIFEAFWISFGTAAILAYPIFRMLLAAKSRQTIDPFAPESHRKKQGTPTMGGLIVLAGLIPSLIKFQTDFALLLLLVCYMLIGFADDFVVPRLMSGKRGLGWKQKIVLQLIFALLALWMVPEFAGSWQAFALGAFLILFFSNAYNLSDGLDGLAGGLLAVIAAYLAFFSPYSVIGFATLGALIPFLFLNAPPARVFMGDVGSLPLGAILGLIFAKMIWLQELGTREYWIQVACIVAVSMVLIIELVLVPIQVAWYKRTKKRLFPATPIHHGFEKMGWPETRIVWTFILAQVLCCALSVTIAAAAVGEPVR